MSPEEPLQTSTVGSYLGARSGRSTEVAVDGKVRGWRSVSGRLLRRISLV